MPMLSSVKTIGQANGLMTLEYSHDGVRYRFENCTSDDLAFELLFGSELGWE